MPLEKRHVRQILEKNLINAQDYAELKDALHPVEGFDFFARRRQRLESIFENVLAYAEHKTLNVRVPVHGGDVKVELITITHQFHVIAEAAQIAIFKDPLVRSKELASVGRLLEATRNFHHNWLWALQTQDYVKDVGRQELAKDLNEPMHEPICAIRVARIEHGVFCGVLARRLVDVVAALVPLYRIDLTTGAIIDACGFSAEKS